ncbi:MAG TPA: hypothetical protein VNL18_06215 [Gemmatimonadales bacterium]|nr:hypothetical protein [Gemmatimonadales bacterium]
MRSVRSFTLAALALGLAACEDDPLKSGLPETPAPPNQGVQAFIQVDNAQARPGDEVRVFVRMQFGTESGAKLGSYTGRLTFDPEVVAFKSESKIDDGLRVTNPNNAGAGELRFAGASATGFNDLTLFEGLFLVKKDGFLDAFKLQMEEVSAASTLANLAPGLDVPNRVFQRPGIK